MVVPHDKLEVYQKNEKPLPDGWAMDAIGQPGHKTRRKELESKKQKLVNGILINKNTLGEMRMIAEHHSLDIGKYLDGPEENGGV